MSSKYWPIPGRCRSKLADVANVVEASLRIYSTPGPIWSSPGKLGPIWTIYIFGKSTNLAQDRPISAEKCPRSAQSAETRSTKWAEFDIGAESTKSIKTCPSFGRIRPNPGNSGRLSSSDFGPEIAKARNRANLARFRSPPEALIEHRSASLLFQGRRHHAKRQQPTSDL